MQNVLHTIHLIWKKAGIIEFEIFNRGGAHNLECLHCMHKVGLGRTKFLIEVMAVLLLNARQGV